MIIAKAKHFPYRWVAGWEGVVGCPTVRSRMSEWLRWWRVKISEVGELVKTSIAVAMYVPYWWVRGGEGKWGAQARVKHQHAPNQYSCWVALVLETSVHQIDEAVMWHLSERWAYTKTFWLSGWIFFGGPIYIHLWVSCLREERTKLK